MAQLCRRGADIENTRISEQNLLAGAQYNPDDRIALRAYTQQTYLVHIFSRM